MRTRCQAGVVLALASGASAQCSFTTSPLDTYDLLGRPASGQVQSPSDAWTYWRSDLGRQLLTRGVDGQGQSWWSAADQPFQVPIVYPRCSNILARNEVPFARHAPTFEGLFFHPGYNAIDVLAILAPQQPRTITALVLQAETLGADSPNILFSAVIERPGGNVTLIPPTSAAVLAPALTLSPAPGLLPAAMAPGDRLVVRANNGGTPFEDWGNMNATVTLSGPPLLLASPEATSGCAGVESATFRVAAAGASSYQWRRAGAPLSDGPTPFGSVISGSGGPVLSIAPLSTSDAGVYDCVVTNLCGPATTQPALLSVPCCPDVNRDGAVDQGDIDYLINVVGGGENPTGIDPDFNGDGIVDQGDVDALIDVVAGGNCP